MKKMIILAVIGLAIAAPDTRAQTFPLMPHNFAVQDGENTSDPDQAAMVSAHYALSTISLSEKHLDTGSILSWRDIYLHGAQINVEFNKAPLFFNKTNIGAGFHKSFQGYSTDDDANNDFNVIYVTSTKAILLDLKYEILQKNDIFSPKLGLDFNFLKLDNYNAKPFIPNEVLFIGFFEGLADSYDVYNLAGMAGMHMKIATGIFYLNMSGQIGPGIYIALADWVLRTDFKHPISFYNIGLSLSSGGDLELGFRFGRFTIFTKALLSYEISPIGINNQNLSNGNTAIQLTFFDLFHAALNTGLKVSF
jgi:hypothetical protein